MPLGQLPLHKTNSNSTPLLFGSPKSCKMKQKAQLGALIFSLLLTMSIHPCLLHSRSLGTPPPSLAPASGEAIGDEARQCKGRNDERRKGGSSPATCHSKCNQCKPCLPVEVSIRAMELEENEYYYPQVWKCMCRHNIFSP